MEKGGAFHLNKRESPLPTEVWLKLSQWFWRRRFLNIYIIIFFISPLSPLGEGRGPSFEKYLFPSTQKLFVRSLVEIDPVVLEKKMKMWKVYDNDDAIANDDGQILIRKANLSLRLDDLKIFYIFCWCTVKTLTPQFISTEK